jgi:crossover junction endodeoxyribonuclease RuvC
MPRVLGIDPGLNRTGWGVIDVDGNRLTFVAAGTIISSAKQPLSERLFYLGEELEKVITLYTPDMCAIEETFVNKNPLSSLKLGHARGALMLTAARHNLIPHEYAATLVKKAIVGVGRAEKSQMMMMIQQLLPQSNVTSEDAADALAVAICHVNHQTFATTA